MLGVQIGGHNYLVDMEDISEVLAMPALTPVPLTQPWFKGVANVRGNLYCVSDIGNFIYQKETATSINNRLLLVAEHFSINVALLVEKVFGLRDTSRWGHDAPSENIFYDEYGAQWIKLDISGLLGQADFLQIGI